MKASTRLLYDYVRLGTSGTLYPPLLHGVEGAVDVHIHAGHKGHDPIALAKHASRAGMRGLLFKVTDYPSVEMARTATEAARAWAEQEGVTPVTCYGGVVLDQSVGGINIVAAQHALRMGGRALWFPVLTAANHIARTREVSLEEAKKSGIYILDRGRLTQEAKDIVHLAADTDVMLGVGHLSHEEIFALAEEVASLGFTKAVVDHPLASVTDLTLDQVEELARSGFSFILTNFEISPVEIGDLAVMVELVKTVGPERVALSSDCSLPIFPDPVECMRLMSALMTFSGFDDGAVKQMNSRTALRLLGVQDS